MRLNSYSGSVPQRNRRAQSVIALAITIALTLADATFARAAAPNPAEIVALQSANLEAPLVAGRSSTILVSAHIADGWHINSDKPIGAYAIPTRLAVTAPAQVSVGAVVYPE